MLSFSEFICPDPGQIDNGYYSPDTGPYYYPTTVTYTCNPGWTMVGQSEGVCLQSEKWNSIPMCTRKYMLTCLMTPG